MSATRVARMRAALRRAIDSACIARGEAQWMNGYRTAAHALPAEDRQLYEKEMARYKHCAIAEATTEWMIRAFASAVREDARRRKAKR